MSDDEGASPREIVVEACRRDQPHLIDQVLEGMKEKTNEEIAEFINNVKDALGNYAIHICAMYGSYEVMDNLFDIEFFECDPLTRLDKEAPLHLAVRFANEKDLELGHAMITMMCEAGCDPRVRNKRNQKAADLVYADYKDVKLELQKAEYVLVEGLVEDEDSDVDPNHNSASDSE